MFVSCCSCFVLHLLESSIYNLGFFFHVVIPCAALLCYSPGIALFALLFLHYSFGIVLCIVFLTLPFLALLFLTCCHSFCIVALALSFFLHCCSYVAPFTSPLPHYNCHVTPPTLRLSCCPSRATALRLLFSCYSSYATPHMLLLSSCNT